MTDSRAALEERARDYFVREVEKAGYAHLVGADLVKFAEQESSSLKLLLSAMCRVLVDLYPNLHPPSLAITMGRHRKLFRCEFDSSGIPVLTQEIIEALKNAAIL